MVLMIRTPKQRQQQKNTHLQLLKVVRPTVRACKAAEIVDSPHHESVNYKQPDFMHSWYYKFFGHGKNKT